MVPCELIDVRPGGQDRKVFDPAHVAALAASIAADGCLSHPHLRPVGDRFEIILGECRIRAMRDVLGWVEIPAWVEDVDDRTASRRMLVENVNRADLDPMAEARAYQDRVDRFDVTPVTIAAECGIPVARVRDRLKLLALSDHVAHFVETKQLPVGHAQAMVRLDKPRQALALQAFQDGAASVGMFREVCSRLLDEQAAEEATGMFDAGTFLQNPEWQAEVAAYVAPPAVEVVREQAYGIDEAGALLGVSGSHVRAMLRRGAFPAPDLTVSRAPAWWAGTLDAWCADTGHARPMSLDIAV